MGVFKDLLRYTLGRNLSKKNPHLAGTVYMALGSMNDDMKKQQKDVLRDTPTETSGKFASVFIVVVIVLLVIGFIGSSLTDKKEEKPKVKENTDSRKVYKTDSQEYFKMLDSTASKIADNYDKIYLLRTKTYAMTYFHIILYSHKYIKEEDYKKIKESYVQELKEELSKYKYKESFLNNYNIVQVYFYNLQNHYPYNREMYTWVQFYTTDLD